MSVENGEDSPTGVDLPGADTGVISTGDQLRRSNDSEEETRLSLFLSLLLVSTEN